MNKKGFLLIDSLIAVFIVCIVAVLCLSVFKSINNFDEGYISYKVEINDELLLIYANLGECEKCLIEEDLSE